MKGDQRSSPWKRALQSTKNLAKRSLQSAGPERMVRGAIEVLRAAEARYSRSTLAPLLADVIARSDTARRAQLCQAALELWQEDPSFAPYALRVFVNLERHLETCGFELGAETSVCEFGPGDSLCLAALIAAKGASYVGIDPWPATLEPPLYQLAASYFREHAQVDLEPWIDSSSDPVKLADSIQRRARSQEIATNSMDLVFSVAVFEHVRNPRQVLAESIRVLRPGGYAIHQIDYEDHRGRGPAGWDFLRFSTAEWDRLHEGELARDYTNRVRHSQWVRLLDEVGYETVQVTVERAETPPGVSVHEDLGSLADDDLEIQSAHFILRKPTHDNEARA